MEETNTPSYRMGVDFHRPMPAVLQEKAGCFRRVSFVVVVVGATGLGDPGATAGTIGAAAGASAEAFSPLTLAIVACGLEGVIVVLAGLARGPGVAAVVLRNGDVTNLELCDDSLEEVNYIPIKSLE